MGAAASVKKIYEGAVNWFREYIDTDTYMKDFESIDKDHDGGINFGEIKKWLESKAEKEGGSWRLFSTTPAVVAIAHKFASISVDSHSSGNASKIVDIQEFRNFLVQLFAVSILWVHFENADTWADQGDAGNKQLNRDEFKLAVLTLCQTNAHEVLTEEQINQDFNLLDVNLSNSVSFMEVCNHCSKYIDPRYSSENDLYAGTNTRASFFGVNDDALALVSDVMEELESGPKQYYDSLTVDQKNENAVNQMVATIEDQHKAASAIAKALRKAAEARTASGRISPKPVSVPVPDAPVETTVFTPRLSPRLSAAEANEIPK